MAEAIYALAGALIGVSGAFVIELTRARIEKLRSRRDALRLSCADFIAAVTRMRTLAIQLMSEQPTDAKLMNSFHEAHGEARVHYERLRLTSASGAVQKAARYVLRYAYGLLRQIEGKPARDDEREHGPLITLQHSLITLVSEVRREIGVPHSQNVYREPDEWMDRDV
jgi:hypothetical protein